MIDKVESKIKRLTSTNKEYKSLLWYKNNTFTFSAYINGKKLFINYYFTFKL